MLIKQSIEKLVCPGGYALSWSKWRAYVFFREFDLVCQNFDCPIYEGINYDETPFLQFDMLSPVFTCTGEIT
jgi:hypothetical protein